MHPTILRILTAVLIFAASVQQTLAQDSSPSYNFLNIASSTRVYGLGGVNISTIDDDINVVDQNPGLLGAEIGMQLGVNYITAEFPSASARTRSVSVLTVANI